MTDRIYPLLLAATFTVAAHASAQPFRVGALEASRGETVSGELIVPDGVDAGTTIPVSVIHGARPGRVLGLVAGNHGYEYPPILALQRLRQRIDPEELAGTLGSL